MATFWALLSSPPRRWIIELSIGAFCFSHLSCLLSYLYSSDCQGFLLVAMATALSSDFLERAILHFWYLSKTPFSSQWQYLQLSHISMVEA